VEPGRTLGLLLKTAHWSHRGSPSTTKIDCPNLANDNGLAILFVHSAHELTGRALKALIVPVALVLCETSKVLTVQNPEAQPMPSHQEPAALNGTEEEGAVPYLG